MVECSYFFVSSPLLCRCVRFNVRLLKELVQTYTEENAQRGKEYAEALIVHSVSDPSSFVLDDLLTFPAVKVLEGEKVHEVWRRLH